MGVQIIKFRPCNKNTLRGFLSVRMTGVGLEIRDISLHEKDGKKWLAMPSRPYEDHEGNRKYTFILDWFDQDRKTQFESTVFALLREGNHGQGS